MPVNIEHDFTAISTAHNRWRSKMRGNSPPFRSDFVQFDGTREILIERDAKSGAIIRYASDRLENVSGGILAGRQLSSLFVDFHRPRVDKAIEKFFDECQELRLEIDLDGEGFECLLLPVRADHGFLDYGYGASDINTIGATRPLKFGLRKTHANRIISRPPAKVIGFAEGRAPFRPPTKQFRVIDGNTDAPHHTNSGLKIVQTVKREP